MEIYFILVGPKVPENIGASARAVKTMGFHHLRLVDPPNYPNEKAGWVAHGSHDILEHAKIFPALDEAISDLDFVIGTSAKERRVKNDYYPIHQLNSVLERKNSIINKTGIVFGREESGLTNREIQLCDLISTIPLYKPFPSLNLSHAVMLYAYHLSGLPGKVINELPADTNSFRELVEKISLLLEKSGIPEGSIKYNRIMERLSLTGSDDLSLLHTVSNVLLKKLEE